MSWDLQKAAQLKLPDPADEDPHPRLLLEGSGIHARGAVIPLCFRMDGMILLWK